MEYKIVSEPEKPKTVTVITPTIASPKLIDAVQSVAAQTYEHVTHLIVLDGGRYRDKFYDITIDNPLLFDNKLKVKISMTPENTGADGFYGHRIYAGYPHLINSDYIFFLDEDNWYKPNHVETLVEVLKDNEFAYSLREIYDENKEYICDDNCESLGKWPIWFTHDKTPQYLIDTSSFAFRTSFLIKTCQLWHSGWGGDRRYYNLIREQVKHDTNGQHTLCYRLDGNPNSVKPEFFEQGNEDNHKRYNGVFPWIKGKK